jgi:hypothetical protein
MSCETVHTGVSDSSAASNISAQTQNQRPRARIFGANVLGPPLAPILFDWNANSVPEFFKQPQALFCAKDDAIARLRALVDEYTTDRTITIHPGAVETAKRFLRALPEGVSLPEFSVEPDGFISMDWIAARDRVFSISVGVHNRFACAWIDGTSEGHCVENFDWQTIPKRIIDGITAIVRN